MFFEFMGGSTWYVWMMSGSVSGVVFILIALKIAPEENSISVRLTFSTVVLLGILSALGTIIVGQNMTHSLAGIAMAFSAFYMIAPFKDKMGKTL